MQREQKQRENTKLRVRKHRVTATSNANVTPPSPLSPLSPSPTTLNKLPKGNSRTKDCPHQKIINQYHEILPELPYIQIWDNTSKKNLKTRWREDSIRQDIEFWKTYFTWIKKSKFLMGNKTDFQADLHWLVKPTNFAKVINGRYHNKQNFHNKLMKAGNEWIKKRQEMNNS